MVWLLLLQSDLDSISISISISIRCTFGIKQQQKKCDTFSICACHPCAGAMLIFSVSFQFLRMTGCDPGSDHTLHQHTTNIHTHTAPHTHAATTLLAPPPRPAPKPHRTAPHRHTLTQYAPHIPSRPVPSRPAIQTTVSLTAPTSHPFHSAAASIHTAQSQWHTPTTTTTTTSNANPHYTTNRPTHNTTTHNHTQHNTQNKCHQGRSHEESVHRSELQVVATTK